MPSRAAGRALLAARRGGPARRCSPPGEGHAHVHVGGEKIGRVHGAHYHIGGLASGGREIRVTLNANTHAACARDGAAVEAVARVTAP